MTSALAEQYRPYALKDVVGQEGPQRVIGGWFRTNRVPRTIMIQGSLSTGKTTFARIIGRTMLCHERTKAGEACGKCGSCSAFDNEQHPDYLENDAAKERGIDAMREMAKKLAHMPLFGPSKVVVLDEAQEITKPAWKALLKTLEHPPAHVVLIIATTNPELVPDTIRSRCSNVVLTDLTREQCTGLLMRVVREKKLDQAGITEEHMVKVAQVTRSRPRNALHALDQIYTMVLDQQSGTQALSTAIINGIIEQVTAAGIEASAAVIVRSVLDGKPGAAMKRAEDVTDMPELLRCIVALGAQALRYANAPKLMDEYYATLFEGLTVFRAPDAKQVILDTVAVFTRLRMDTANHAVPIAEVLDEAICRAGLLCQVAKRQITPNEPEKRPAKEPAQAPPDALPLSKANKPAPSARLPL